ncbi:MAG: glycosyltransferase [Methanomassiliicoccaceae archaeon]|nr:glycosyltransferase [Methanomassiliicoccaceae archaeon]
MSSGRITLIRSPPEKEEEKTGLGIYSDKVEAGLRGKGMDPARITVGIGVGVSEKNILKRIRWNILHPFKQCIASGWNGVFHATDEFCSICFPFLGGKKVMTFHHYQGDDTKTFFLFIWKIVVRIGIKLSDRIIAISPKSKKDLMEHYGVPEEKISVIMNNISDKFRTTGIPRTRTIGVIGTLTKRKNVGAAIHAFRKLIDMPGTEDMRMKICGRGPVLPELKELAKELGIEDKVTFVAGLTDDEVVEMYNSVQILANPSMIEGFGLSTLEAQRCSTPVVCFKDADIPDEVKLHAVQSADTDDFADNMHRLLVDDEYRKKVVADGKTYADGFGNDFIEKVIDVYEN